MIHPFLSIHPSKRPPGIHFPIFTNSLGIPESDPQAFPPLHPPSCPRCRAPSISLVLPLSCYFWGGKAPERCRGGILLEVAVPSARPTRVTFQRGQGRAVPWPWPMSQHGKVKDCGVLRAPKIWRCGDLWPRSPPAQCELINQSQLRVGDVEFVFV